MSRSTLGALLAGLVAGLWTTTLAAEENVYLTAGSDSPSGLHYWIDFVSTGRGSQIMHGDAKARRLAHSGNVGFGWDGDWVAVHVTDSLAEYGQLVAAGNNALINTLSPLTNPSVVVSFRPVKMLRLDVEADLLWAFDMQNGPGDFSYTSLFGGAFAVFEPLARYVGYFPLIEVGLGARGGMAWSDLDQVPAGMEWKGARVMTGMRARLVLPFAAARGAHWSDAGFFLGGGCFVDPIAGYDAKQLFKRADVEWTLGLRWFM